METYKEIVYRYRVMRHEELPAAHKAEYRLNGIDPDTLWSLIWSFKNKEDAEAELQRSNEKKAKFQTYKMVDAGKDEVIERTAWF